MIDIKKKKKIKKKSTPSHQILIMFLQGKSELKFKLSLQGLLKRGRKTCRAKRYVGMCNIAIAYISLWLVYFYERSMCMVL